MVAFISSSRFLGVASWRIVYTERVIESRLESAMASDALSPVLVNLRQFFSSSKATASTLASVVSSSVSEASSLTDLDIVVKLMNGYKSNNLAPQKRRVQDESIDWTSVEVPESPVLPKKLEDAILKRRRVLQGVEGGAPPSSRPSSSHQFQENDSPDCEKGSNQLLVDMGKMFSVDADKIHVRNKDKIFSLVDMAVLVTGKDTNYASQQIRILRSKYSDIHEKIMDIKFPGRKQKLTPAAELQTLVEVIMLLPGARAGLVRVDAAKLFIRYHGGDLGMVDEVMRKREMQDDLRLEQPENPRRLFGEDVEERCGSTDDQKRELIKKLQEGEKMQKRGTSYDPAKMTEEHHRHKDNMNKEWIELLQTFHGDLASLTEGYLAILDDEDQQGVPRTSNALLREGFKPDLILAPNREQSVVAKLLDLGVKSVKKDFRRALDSDYQGSMLLGAYVDSTTGDTHELQNMMEAVRSKGSRKFPLVAGYTIVERDFTRGGRVPFGKRVLEMCDYMRDNGFKPAIGGEMHRSYYEPRDSVGLRTGTHFWVRPAAVTVSDLSSS